MPTTHCTCGPRWVYEPGCGFPHRDDIMCEWCEDAEERERLEAFAWDEAIAMEDALMLGAEILRSQGVDVADLEFF